MLEKLSKKLYFAASNKEASSLRGEWWIVDGQAIYADGDVGDMNHEAYVIQSIQGMYADEEFNRGEYIDWDGFEKHLLEEGIAGLGDAEYDEDEIVYNALKELGMTDEEIKVARGQHGDAREYGLKNLGWKRIKGDNVQTQTLTSGDLSDIARGLWEISESSGMDNETEFTVDIEVYSNGTLFRDVPYSVISEKKPELLYQYRIRLDMGGYMLSSPSVVSNWYKRYLRYS
jgi:hypothetical protein